MDAGSFFQHQAELVLRHLMQVSNYFVNSFYSEVQNHMDPIDPDPDLQHWFSYLV
jgi:hypothetical protein